VPNKCILLLLDGLGDRSCPELGGKTPLQAARTPNLDRLAEGGSNGLFHAGSLGEALPSENAHFAMFGYGPDLFPGRGPLEALGASIQLDPGDVAVLAHFIAMENRDGVLHYGPKPGLSDKEMADLLDAVGHFSQGPISIRFERTKGDFGILKLAGPVAPFVTDSNPMRRGSPLSAILPWDEYKDDTVSRQTASALGTYLAWVYRTLAAHPVNSTRLAEGRLPASGLVTQRAGRLKGVVPFSERYGMRGLTVSSGFVYIGLARYLGMNVIKAGESKDWGGDFAERIKTAGGALETHDFIHVHTKGPDEAGHAKDPLEKVRVIEELDRAVAEIFPLLKSHPDLVVVVTADHSTPSTGPLVHSGEPVPLTIIGPGVRVDNVRRFDEVSVAGGALGCVRGTELMSVMLNAMDRIKLTGIMDQPKDHPYWPGNYTPFRV
jgi:2,3-bisphosphoglycerate-independent phosphoglycerate mutase